jgi:hypothetical protein
VSARSEHATKLLALASGYEVTQLVVVAARLGIADLLAAGPRTVDDLAAATGTHPPSLFRVLRALAGHGVFAEEDGRFRLTPLAEPLRGDAPDSIRPHLDQIAEWGYRVWGELLHSVTTGSTAFEHLFGMTNWEYRARTPEASELFHAQMAERARVRGRILVKAQHFPDGATIVDVGGGEGTILAAILAANPTLRGVLQDLPHVVAGAPPRLAAAGVADRCQIEGGDFFVAVPRGGDAYLLAAVLHDWGDEDAIRILVSCREAMRPDSTLVLAELVVPSGNDPHVAKMLDILMLLTNVGGRERNEAEWEALLVRAGFTRSRTIGTGTPLSLIEARVSPG